MYVFLHVMKLFLSKKLVTICIVHMQLSVEASPDIKTAPHPKKKLIHSEYTTIVLVNIIFI